MGRETSFGPVGAFVSLACALPSSLLAAARRLSNLDLGRAASSLIAPWASSRRRSGGSHRRFRRALRLLRWSSAAREWLRRAA
jgi:hypothetical protein